MPTVTALYRYPVKGLSPETLAEMPLTQGGLEHDRMHALALGTTPFDPAAPQPLAKTNFLMLARNESLARLATQVDAAGVLTIKEGGETQVAAQLDSDAGRAAIGAWFTAFAGDAARGQIRVVSSPGHRFTDIGAPAPAQMHCVSVINLASLRALEGAMGRSLDPLRFRANIYIDGLPAWAEFNWLEGAVHIGAVPFRCVRRTRRCPATNVDPSTAQRDTDVPAALRAHFGHADLGVYLAVEAAGRLALGDAVTV